MKPAVILLLILFGLLLFVGVRRTASRHVLGQTIGQSLLRRFLGKVKPVAQTTPPAPVPSKPPVSGGNGSNPYGVMIVNQVPNLTTRINTAKTLGSAYYRPADVKVDQWTGSCSECDAAQGAGLKLALTIRNGGGGGVPSTPPTDLNAYKNTVGKILDTYHPALLVVENEENSGTLFYSGTPDQYHQELAAACQVARERNIKCTNGGLVSSLVTALTAANYDALGQTAQAQSFLSRAFSPEKAQQYQKAKNTAAFTAQIDKGKQLIAGYKSSGADYINFHWYNADPGALGETVAYLQSASGLPALSNEMGQQQNEDPAQVTGNLQKSLELKLPVVVWFSVDINGFGGARSLVNSDGSLRPNGQAFQSFISQNFK